jgi:hypothetical protein
MFLMAFQVFFCEYFKHMFKCFICLLLHVANIAFGCSKSKSTYWICCNGVSSVCPKILICFRRICYKCFIWML